MRLLLLVLACVAGGLSVPAAGQNTMDWPTGRVEPYHLDSGSISNATLSAGTVFLDVVRVRNAGWLRLYFGEVALSRGSFIRITSTLDGEVQELDRRGLAMWGNTSAYFNGDTVIVELVAGPGAADNRLVIEKIGRHAQPVGDPGQCGICDDDDRVPSNELWSSRLLPAGCTASIYNESSCLVSAGHCIGGSMVIHFNVPDSNGNCSINNPPVADQFPIVTSDSVNGGVGNDWSVLIPGTNSSGELPYERYGELRPIASSPASNGQTVTVWGYGVDTTCTRSQTQQTSSGPITNVTGSLYNFEVDIRGGNSGSSLIESGEIVGIVTHCNSGGCPAFDNTATRIDLPAFVAARDTLCSVDNLNFSFPDGLPALIAPSGGTTTRVVVSADTGTPQPGTGLLHVSIDGGPFSSSAMSINAPNDYDAVFPAVGCASIVEFYFSAETTGGAVVTSPATAPDQVYVAIGADNVTTEFDDDFESDQGWSVSNSGLTDGAWERDVPISNAVCDRGNPGSDADGSGQCYLTDNSSANACNSDVDDGSTTLTSPAMDASDPDATISYWRWFSTAAGGNPFQDVFVVEVSDDDGSSWTTLETVGPSGLDVNGGWFRKTFRVGDFVSTTNEFRIRFTASDTDPQSVVEAAVDGVLLQAVSCGLCGNGVMDPGEDCESCPADVPCPPGTECIAGACVPLCGNGVVDPGEDCENCPADVQCPPDTECVNGMCERLCGNGVVDPGENCENCPADVQCPAGTECVDGMCEQLCGNGVVDPGEDCTNCPADVPCPAGTVCIGGVCVPLCGNGVVDPGEDCANCPADVQCAPDEQCIGGICEPLCGNGVIDPGEDCETCPADVQCAPDEECIGGVCMPLCGNGVVDPGEDCDTCPADVQCAPDEACVGGVCTPLCGNGVVDPGEDCDTCPADVQCAPDEECVGGVCTPLCGNGVVDPGEDCDTCPADVQCAPDEACIGGVCSRLCGNGAVDPGEDCQTCPADVQCAPGEQCVGGVCEPACPWDLDGNGAVGTSDLLDLLAQWATDPGGPPDFDGDGMVGTSDLLKLLASWGTCP